MWRQFRPYVPVARRRAQAAREIARRRKRGQIITAVVIEGRAIAHTFWGKAWCDNLESYSDFENRLPRGRTYVRNGAVMDLQIHPGRITAVVSGSELYQITISITPLDNHSWRGIKSRCAGQIGSLVELLQGRLSKGVMDIVTAREGGLFPKPREIKLSCSCPDWAGMCKHVAAALYGVGARLDQQPELLFLLRKVDHLELIADAAPRASKKARTGSRTLSAGEIAGVFGIELAEPGTPDREPASPAQAAKPTRRAARRSEPGELDGPKVGKSSRHAGGGRGALKAAAGAKRPRAVKKVPALGR
jgi:uncharacterized Zn finger protein